MGISLINSDGTIHKIAKIDNNFKLKYNGYLSGLIGVKYSGYHYDNPAWFDTATLQGDTNTLTSINSFSSSPDGASEDYYSWQWLGYFKPSTTDTYTFYTSSDDGSYLWIGESANNPTVENSLVNNGGAHGSQEVNGSIELIANTYYPIRIQFGEISGGDNITVSFSSNTIAKTTDGSNYYFNDGV